MPASLGAAMHEAQYGLWMADCSPAHGDIAPGEVVRASHPRQQYRAEFRDDGACVTSSAGGWSLGLKLVAFGAEGKTTEVGTATRHAEGRRVEYRRNGIVEWYVNGDAALEHGFRIAEESAGGSEKLQLILDCGGGLPLTASSDGAAVEFLDATGKPAMTYAKLMAYDALHQALPAHMAIGEQGLTINVDARDAVYPVVIDPELHNDAKLIPLDEQYHSYFGRAVDIDGSTLVVGAHNYDIAGSGSGAAFVFERNGTEWQPQAKLSPSDGAIGDAFGWAVTVHGDTLVAGAQNDNDNGSSSGSAYVFVRTGALWSQQAKLLPDDGDNNDIFGNTVDIDGDTVVVGAPWDEDNGSSSGSAYVFVRSVTVWSQQEKLLPSDGAASDQFGSSVSISGDTVIVGAQYDADQGDDSGSAYVFVRSGGVWSQQAKLLASDGAEDDNFGHAVSVDGDTAVVGAWYNDNIANHSGAAYVYVRNVTTWSEQAKLLPTATTINKYLGVSVSISGDTVVAGSSGDDDNGSSAGAAYVYVRDLDVWSLQEKLVPADCAASDACGKSVGVSGDLVVVGAHQHDNTLEDTGCAYAYVRTGSAWSQEAKVLPVSILPDDEYGKAVAIDSDTAVIGAPGADDNGLESGAAFVFVKSGSVWSHEAKLLAPDGEAGDAFGTAVDIDVDTAVIGAVGDDETASDAGAVYVFNRTAGTWYFGQKVRATDGIAGHDFGGSVSVSGDTLIAGAYCDDDNGTEAGAAYVYVRSTSWDIEQKLTPSGAQAGDWFGFAVALDGDRAIVSSPYYDSGYMDCGCAYVFLRSTGTWSQEARLQASDEYSDDFLGRSVAIDGTYAVIGANANDDNGDASGSAYVFVRNGSWSQQTKLLPVDGDADDSFGWSVAVSGDTVIVGANNDEPNGTGSGSAYVFIWNGAAWIERAKLLPEDGVAGAAFGQAVAVSGDQAVVGAYAHAPGGAAYVYTIPVPGAVTQFVIADPTDGTVDAPIQVAVVAQDGYGELVMSCQDDVSLNATGSATGDGLVTMIDGTGQIWLSDQVAETVALTLTDSQGTGFDVSSTQDVAFGHGATTKYVILDPTDGTVDAPVTVSMQAQDQYNNVATSCQDDVTLVTSGSATGAGLVDIVDGTGTRDISDQVAETVDLSLSDSETTGHNVDSTQDVVFAHGAATAYVIADPTDGTVDAPITVTVNVHDQYGNTVTSHDTDVTLVATGDATGAGIVDIGSGTGSLDISDHTPETVDLSLSDSQSTGLDVSSTQDVVFAHGATTKYVILDPTDGTVDAPITVTVEAQDQYDNVTTSCQDDVTLAASGSTTGAGLVNIVDGTGTRDISDQVAETVDLTLTDSQTTGHDVSSTEDAAFGHGVADHLAFTVQPSDAGSDTAITPAVEVSVQDQYDNTCTDATDPVTVDIETNPGTGTLSGTLTVSASSGVAAFSDLGIDEMGAGYTLTADSGSLTGATSDTFDIRQPAVTGFTATTASESRIDLAWTNPTNAAFAGIVIFRRSGAAPTVKPTDGTTYTVGSTYGDADCVYSDSTTSHNDAGLTELTQYFYAAYAYADAATPGYSPVASADATTSAGAAPTIEGTSPAANAVGVYVGTTIEITFSEPMNTGSVEGAFSVDKGVTGGYSWSNNTLIYTPGQALAEGTTYTVTIGTGAQDLVGLPIASTYTLTFTTETFVGMLGGGCAGEDADAGAHGAAAAALVCIALGLMAMRASRKVQCAREVS